MAIYWFCLAKFNDTAVIDSCFNSFYFYLFIYSGYTGRSAEKSIFQGGHIFSGESANLPQSMKEKLKTFDGNFLVRINPTRFLKIYSTWFSARDI